MWATTWLLIPAVLIYTFRLSMYDKYARQLVSELTDSIEQAKGARVSKPKKRKARRVQRVRQTVAAHAQVDNGLEDEGYTV